MPLKDCWNEFPTSPVRFVKGTSSSAVLTNDGVALCLPLLIYIEASVSLDFSTIIVVMSLFKEDHWPLDVGSAIGCVLANQKQSGECFHRTLRLVQLVHILRNLLIEVGEENT